MPDLASEPAQINTTLSPLGWSCPSNNLFCCCCCDDRLLKPPRFTQLDQQEEAIAPEEAGRILEAESLKPHGDNFAQWEAVDRKALIDEFSFLSPPPSETVLRYNSPTTFLEASPEATQLARLSQGFGQLSMPPSCVRVPCHLPCSAFAHPHLSLGSHFPVKC